MKYYAYYRCSTQTQMENNGFEMQYEAVANYCKLNDIEITESFEDAGISGTKFDRDGLANLLAVLEEGDKVVVMNTSRLWRDNMVCGLIMYELRKLKADVLSVEQPTYSVYETDDVSSMLLNGILQVLDQYDRVMIKKKLAKGRRAKANAGSKSCGRMPIGYRWNDTETVIDKTADIVRDIFGKCIEYKGNLSAIKRFCDSEGYTTSTGKQFSVQSIKNIIHNDFYIGIVTYDGKKVSGKHEPIIDKELFDKANTMVA